MRSGLDSSTDSVLADGIFESVWMHVGRSPWVPSPTAQPGTEDPLYIPAGVPAATLGRGEGLFQSCSSGPDIPGMTSGVAGGNGRRWGSRIGVWDQ